MGGGVKTRWGPSMGRGRVGVSQGEGERLREPGCGWWARPARVGSGGVNEWRAGEDGEDGKS
jgi:hypothetical protein